MGWLKITAFLLLRNSLKCDVVVGWRSDDGSLLVHDVLKGKQQALNSSVFQREEEDFLLLFLPLVLSDIIT